MIRAMVRVIATSRLRLNPSRDDIRVSICYDLFCETEPRAHSRRDLRLGMLDRANPISSLTCPASMFEYVRKGVGILLTIRGLLSGSLSPPAKYLTMFIRRGGRHDVEVGDLED